MLRRFLSPLALSGWLLSSSLPLPGQPVINEIHYDPPDKTEPGEFIELVNPSPAAVPLAGWRLSGGVNYAFPPQASIPPGGYVVVAQDPAHMRARYGIDALGPWEGRLRNRDDTLRLRDATDTLVDEVDYRLGFPWPTVGEAPGYSIELIHPGLDNNLGGHWRSSVAGGSPASTRSEIIPAGGTWRFLRGTREASSPASAWRAPAFEDAAWEEGRLPIGYDPSLALGTRLDDMRGQYTTVFLRRPFPIADAASVTALEFHALYDDGFRVWINGQQILNVNLAPGELAATATAGPARESEAYDVLEASLNPGILRDGENVIAVQALNSSLNGSSDFYLDLRLVAIRGPSGRGPTPGRANVAFASNAPPAPRQVAHSPRQPAAGQPVVVSARITDPDGVASATLRYQVVEPGAYLERVDPAFETAWVDLPMRDDGLGADAVAGDSTFTAAIPASVQVHRRLVRYRIAAADTRGAVVQAPYPDDPQPNFAYFVYDGVPAWTGTLQPGASGSNGQPFTVSREEMNRLPVIHLLAKRTAVENSTWFSRYGGDAYLWTGTLVYDGEVYDHIRYRARGGVWRYAMCKNMWKFDFNRGHDFQPRDDWGRRLATGWTKLNLGASIQQGDYNHRGEQGMFESVGYRVFNLAGVPAMRTTYVQFRVIDDAAEAPPADQYSGDFWGVYLMIEQPDGRFLEEHGLPDGNLYKMEGGGGELNNLGPAGPSDGSDLRDFLSGYNGASETWWRTRFDIPRFLDYQTVVQAIHHYDICYDKNYFYYRAPDSGVWQVLPWDLDLTWAENMYDAGCGGVDQIKRRLLPNATAFPAVWRAWQNRIREFRDLFWNNDEAVRLIDEHAGRLRGPATGPTLLDADRAQWDYNPKMNDSRYSTSPQSKAGTGRFYRWPNYPASTVRRDFEGCLQLMKRYIGFRATNSAARDQALDPIARDAAIPARPRITYAGVEGFPVDALRFRCSPYNGSSGFAAMRWRVGEITPATTPSWQATEPWKYEIEPVWESGTLRTFASDIDVPPSALRVGRVYRARIQFEDAQGRTSHWSDPIEFTAAAPATQASLASSLRLTELMYNSADGAANDFVELHNTGTTTLTLDGSRFTDGITFTFPAGTTLAPGGYLLVVRADPANNFAAFRSRYGLAPTVPIVGPYDGNLSDDGERLTLESPGGGTVLFSITYGDGRGWPAAADAAGHSLVPRRDFGEASSGALDYAGHWRASHSIRGSPGAADPEPADPVVINEVVAHTDFATQFDSNDWLELHQRADAPFVFGAGWYLSDDGRNLRKWQIPAGTSIPARGFVVFDEVTGFNNPPGTGFGLSKGGEEVFLSHFPTTGEPGRVVDAVRFRGQENDWSLARVPDGGAYWDQVAPQTRGGPNAAAPPRVHISEVLFHEGGLPPSTLPPEHLEFVELHNATAQALALYNTNDVWRLSGGIDFRMPLFLSLAANERLVIAAFDPVANPATLAAFRTTFGLPPTVRIIGPFTGRLGNDTDDIALERPQAPDLVGDPISWVIVDEVLYFDRAPWPAATDGQGQSLQRVSSTVPGMNPASWTASSPTPGSGPPAGDPDSDSDGMPDAWETAHGLNPQDPADATTDTDADGLVNRDEYHAGTDPRNPDSSLRLLETRLVGATQIAFRFTAIAGRAYVVESRSSPTSGAWTAVESIPATGTTRDLTVELERLTDARLTLIRVRLQ